MFETYRIQRLNEKIAKLRGEIEVMQKVVESADSAPLGYLNTLTSKNGELSRLTTKQRYLTMKKYESTDNS